MVRIILAGLLGGAVLFGWGAVSRMVLGEVWHQGDTLPSEDRMVAALQTTGTESGIYFFPGRPDLKGLSPEEKEAGTAAWSERHRIGPIGLLVYRDPGYEPMDRMVFVRGFIINVVMALLAAWVLSMAASSIGGYMGRVVFVGLIGLFTGVWAHMVDWNWLSYPLRYSVEMTADTVIGSLLMGLVLAAIIKPRFGGPPGG